jgi:hypothetical protein
MLDSALPSGPWPWIAAWAVLALLAGRVVLAWLPPGLVGGHGARDLLATAGSSFLIGLVLFGAVEPLPSPARIAVAGVLVVLAIVRMLARPAAMVPRHEPPMSASWSGRALVLAGWVVIAWAGREHARDAAAVSGGSAAVVAFVAAAYAVAFLIEHALEVARCAPWARGVGVLSFALVLVVQPAVPERGLEACAALLFVAGTVSTIGWYRRADVRALAIAAILRSGAGVAAPGGWTLAAAGMLWVVIGTPAPSRVRATIWCAVPLALAGAVHMLREDAMTSAIDGSWNPALSPIVVVVFVLVVVARWSDLRRARAREWNPSGAPRGHEDAMLLRTIVTVLLITMAVSTFAPQLPSPDPMRPALLALSVLAGLALGRLSPIRRTRAVA